jgi:hypothetical protein
MAGERCSLSHDKNARSWRFKEANSCPGFSQEGWSEHGGAIRHGKGVDVRLKRDLGQQLSSFSSRSLMHDTDKIFLIGSSICQFCPPDFWLALIGGAALTRGPVLVLVHAHFSP